MNIKTMPFHRYQPFPRIDLPGRTWPDRVIDDAPMWCSVDLRDANQSLIEPMDIATKRILFDLLVRMGFRQIEVGFPASSQIEFDFIRRLIEGAAIPDDVAIQVLTPAREDLIRRTFEAVRGARRVIIHLYVPTSTLQRDVVFGRDRQGMIDLVLPSARLIRRLAEEYPETEWTYEFSPESFTGTELDFALDICSAVIREWRPDPEHKAIINLPATVELSTPNVYADMVEWMSRHLPYRDAITISLHPHNDRGTGLAAAELGLMAGGERVEGTLFGNGERTGNVDLVTLALNLMSQGVDPRLDVSDIVDIVRIVEECMGMAVHPRHPYAGELVFTAVSGSHQDAIGKGLVAQALRQDGRWQVPYLPIDPIDIGRTHRSLIRINSQSGRGGIAYILKQAHQLDLPRGLLIEFSAVVQTCAEQSGGAVEERIGELFWREYVNVRAPVELIGFKVVDEGTAEKRITATILSEGVRCEVSGIGNGPIDAFVRVIAKLRGIDVTVDSYEERSMSGGSEAQAVAFVSVLTSNRGVVWGVGIDTDSSKAALLAILSAVNRYCLVDKD